MEDIFLSASEMIPHSSSQGKGVKKGLVMSDKLASNNGLMGFPGGFPGGSDIRKSAYKRDPDLIPVLGRSSWRMEWLPTGSPDYGSCNARHVKNTQSKVKHLRCSKSQTTSPHLTAEILHVACLVIYLFQDRHSVLRPRGTLSVLLEVDSCFLCSQPRVRGPIAQSRISKLL